MRIPPLFFAMLLLAGTGSVLVAETITVDGGANGLVYSGTVAVGSTSTTAITTANGVTVPAGTTVTYQVNPSGQIRLLPGFVAAVGASFTARIVIPAPTTTIVSGPAGVLVGSATTYTASLVDQFGVPLASQPTFSWSVSGGGSMTPLSPTTASLTAPAAPAAVTIQATGLGIQGQKSVSVQYAAPTSVITKTNTIFPLGYRFNGSGSTAPYPAYPIVSYTWSMPDGSHPTGTVVDYTFPTDGTYSIGLTVVDGRGTSGSSTHSVTVTPSGNVYYSAPDVSTYEKAQQQTYTTYNYGGASAYVGKGWIIDYGVNGKGFKPDKAKGTPYCTVRTIGLWTDNFNSALMMPYEVSYAPVSVEAYVGRGWIEDTVGNGKSHVLVPDTAYPSYVSLSRETFTVRYPGNKFLNMQDYICRAEAYTSKTPCFGRGVISGRWHGSDGKFAMQFTPSLSFPPSRIYYSTAYPLVYPLPQYGTQWTMKAHAIFPPDGYPYYSDKGFGYVHLNGLITTFQPSASN